MARSQRDEHALAADGRSVTISTGAAHSISIGDFPPLDKPALTLSTVSRWMRLNVEGVEHYVPMWT